MTGESNVTRTSSRTAGGCEDTPPPKARLRVVHPRNLCWEQELGPEEVVIGRSETRGAWGLDHPTVSRRHAALRYNDAHGSWEVHDLGSRNGTRVDGSPVHERPRRLGEDAIVQLGDVFLVHEVIEQEDEQGSVDVDAVPGCSPAIQRLRRLMPVVASDGAPALLLGETGTGKEWIARELHRLSGRCGRFIPINCAAIPSGTFESELFGHVRGAFTGATEQKAGVFRSADSGTVFLDEIGELALDHQAKLLRAIEQREVFPVGGSGPVRVDVRIIAATNRDLGARVEEGEFRRDLLARLALWTLELPPLRRRRGDILDWLERFDRLRGDREGKPPLTLRSKAVDAVLRAPWPDNLRGLDRLVHLFVAMDVDAIRLEDLPAWARPATLEPVDDEAHGIRASLADAPSLRKPAVPSPEEFKVAYAEAAGNVSALGRRFQRDRRQIYRWIRAYLPERGRSG